MVRLPRIVTFLSFSVLAFGCRPAEELNIGELVPNFRFRIELNAPISPSRTYEVASSVAAVEGFYKPPPNQHGVLAEMDTDSGRKLFAWKKPSDHKGEYKIYFSWDHDGAGEIDGLWFIFNNHSLDDFLLPEWIEFAKWHDDILPTTFPGATINVTGHPAVFTAPEKRREFSMKSGVELPVKYN